MKKGSISISINMIVYIVVGLVMLGAILGLGQSIISDAQDATGSVSEIVKSQILDDLQRGNKRLSFPQNDVEVGLNEVANMAIGIKNTESAPKLFGIELIAIAHDGTPCDVINRQKVECDNGEGEVGFGKFQFSPAARPLSAGQSDVIPIKYFAQGTQQDTFSFELIVFSQAETETESSEYARKSFFITVQ